MVLHDFYVGASFDGYTWFGAHPDREGFVFRVYAPAAEKVALFGDFNGWQEEDMQLIGTSGVWELSIPQAVEGQLYKYVIYSKEGWKCEHCDPYGFSAVPGLYADRGRLHRLSQGHRAGRIWRAGI